MLDAAILKGALSKLKQTLPKAATAHVLTHICFADGKAKTFDGTCGTILKLDLPLSCCVPGSEFITQVSKLSGDVRLEQDSTKLHVTAGAFKVSFNTLPSVDFPDFVPKDRSELTDDQGISAAFSILSQYASKEADALGGICAVQDRAYSCSGRTATKVLLDKPFTHMVHVPTRFVDAVVKHGSPVCLFRANDMVGAFYDGAVIITQQIVPRFPHEMVEGVFGTQGPEVELPEELGEALKRISPSLGDSGVLKVSSVGQELLIATERAVEALPWSGPVCSFSVGAKDFSAILAETRKVRLGSVLSGENRNLLFVGDKFFHALALGA